MAVLCGRLIAFFCLFGQVFCFIWFLRLDKWNKLWYTVLYLFWNTVTEKSKKNFRKTESCRLMRGAWGVFWIHSRVLPRSFLAKCVGGGGVDRYIKQTLRVLRLVGRPMGKLRWYHAYNASSGFCLRRFLFFLFFLWERKKQRNFRGWVQEIVSTDCLF